MKNGSPESHTHAPEHQFKSIILVFGAIRPKHLCSDGQEDVMSKSVSPACEDCTPVQKTKSIHAHAQKAESERGSPLVILSSCM